MQSVSFLQKTSICRQKHEHLKTEGFSSTALHGRGCSSGAWCTRFLRASLLACPVMHRGHLHATMCPRSMVHCRRFSEAQGSERERKASEQHFKIEIFQLAKKGPCFPASCILICRARFGWRGGHSAAWGLVVLTFSPWPCSLHGFQQERGSLKCKQAPSVSGKVLGLLPSHAGFDNPSYPG